MIIKNEQPHHIIHSYAIFAAFNFNEANRSLCYMIGSKIMPYGTRFKMSCLFMSLSIMCFSTDLKLLYRKSVFPIFSNLIDKIMEHVQQLNTSMS